METRFEEVITTPARLRESSKHPSHRASRVIDHIDDICRRFIAACPFVIVERSGRATGSLSQGRSSRLRGGPGREDAGDSRSPRKQPLRYIRESAIPRSACCS
jgi:hypothetical protein